MLTPAKSEVPRATSPFEVSAEDKSQERAEEDLLEAQLKDLDSILLALAENDEQQIHSAEVAKAEQKVKQITNLIKNKKLGELLKN